MAASSSTSRVRTSPLFPVSLASGKPLPRAFPMPIGPLIGRERELAAAVDLLGRSEVRLITITGPGGVGKTRLALEVAERVSTAFAGVTFVPLAPVANPSHVMGAVLRAIDVPQRSEATVEEALAAALANEDHLLILDNFEHVASVAPWLVELAGRCPGMMILTTSRIRLRLTGEHEFPLLPLAPPDPTADNDEHVSPVVAANPAVALFVHRAVAAKPDFALTSDNVRAVAELCRRLDGLPLAIELAAARSTLLSPRAMLARLSSSLQLLAGGPVDAPPRLRSMRDAVTWSLDLLDGAALRLFRACAVFRGSASIEDVEAIAGDIVVLPALSALVDASLVQKETSADGAIRFQMLETVREVANEHLVAAGEYDVVHACLAARFRRLIDEAAGDIVAGKQDHWFAVLEREQDNLRAAIDWAIGANQAEVALRLIIGPVWFHWSVRGRVRGERIRLERALALVAEDPSSIEPELQARALFTDALYYLDIGDHANARLRFQASIDALADVPNRDRLVLPALTNLAVLDNDRGRYAEARARFETILATRREIGQPSTIASTLVNLGNVANLLGDYPAATRYLEEALPLLRTTGERRALAYCLNNMGETAAGRGRDAEALISFDQALGLFHQTANPAGEGVALVNLAASALRQGDLPRAAAALAEVLEQQRETKTPSIVADALEGAAAVEIASGQPDRAPDLIAVADAIRAAANIVPVPAVLRRRQRVVADAIFTLGDARFNEVTIAARALTIDDAMYRAARSMNAIAPQPVDVPAGIEPAHPHLTPLVRPKELTVRQRDVLRLLIAGSTDPEIAEELGIGVRTVESHVAAILSKLRVHARTAAVAHAVRHGLG